MDTRVKVIIPVYRPNFSPLESQSFNRAYEILNNYQIVAIKPQSLNLDALKTAFPRITIESFPDHFFDGYDGYNRLMLSPDLYQRFIDTPYILIYQLDAYIFSDQLDYFVSKGYDYVGAPWLVRKLYRTQLFSLILKIRQEKSNRKGQPCRQNLYNKIGNGGLSLRKTQSSYEATIKYRERIEFYLSHSNTPLYNEDVFWAIEVPEFHYPAVNDALKFSFDKYPDLCYEENQDNLPMGCHGWYKWKWRGFWAKHIKFEG